MESIQGYPGSCWRVVAASSVGTSHRRAGKGCEDYFKTAIMSNGIHVLAVGDGAGSASRAAEGAQIAVEAALGAIDRVCTDGQLVDSQHGWHDIVHTLLDDVRRALEKAVIQSVSIPPGEMIESMETQPMVVAAPLRDYATTLLVAILSPNWTALLQLGDGMIVIKTESEEYLCPIQAYNDSQYVNDTHFITDSEFRQYAKIEIIDAAEVWGIALLTDGLQALASDMTDRHPYQPFFEPLFAFSSNPTASSAELEAFLDSERVCQRTDDDKTLVVAVRM
jgi:hypothetical protein